MQSNYQKFKKKQHKKHSYFKDRIWGACITDLKLISKYDKEISCVLYFIKVFSKYAWVVSLKSKTLLKLITEIFQTTLDESGCNRLQTFR